jgi:hypothetical protein
VEAKDRQAKEEKRAKEEQEARERAIYLKGFEAGLAKGKAQGNAPALPQPPIAASGECSFAPRVSREKLTHWRAPGSPPVDMRAAAAADGSESDDSSNC